jgi:hypothetical protein
MAASRAYEYDYVQEGSMKSRLLIDTEYEGWWRRWNGDGLELREMSYGMDKMGGDEEVWWTGYQQKCLL